MRFLNFVFIILIFFSLPGHAESKDCIFAFEMKGHQSGSLNFHELIKLCHASRGQVLIEVDHRANPTRTIILSEKEYYNFVAGFKKTMSAFSLLPPSNRSCRHRVFIRIDWEGLQKEFNTCEGDPNFSLVDKFSDLMRDLYQ